MKKVEIRDLEINKELDDKALNSVAGGCYPGYGPSFMPCPPYYPAFAGYFYSPFPFFPYPVYPYPFYGFGGGAIPGMGSGPE